MLYTQNAIFVAFPLVYPSVCLSPDASIMSKRMDISSQLFDTVLTFDLLTLKVASESRVMWATSVPISVFLGLSVLELCPMYAPTLINKTTELSERDYIVRVLYKYSY